jgi:hypothetical protein
MIIPYFISYVLNIIWLIIPFRQIRTDYFFFFLIYAISSAFMLLDHFLLIHPAKIYLGQGFFLIISLYNFKKIPSYIIFLLGLLILSIVLPFLISIEIITFCLIVEHSLIFFIILKKTIQYSAKQEKLNVFHFVLLLFEISVITRFIVVIGNVETGIIFYYLTAAFGILIGVYFLFYNENDSLKIPLSTGIKA